MIHAQVPFRVTPPAELPLTVDEAKDHLRVDHNDENPLIEALIDVVTERLDGYSGVLGRALITQTWQQRWSEFPRSRWLPLPLAPVQSVTVEYLDETGTLNTLDSSRYYLVNFASGPFVELDEDDTWPDEADRPDAVRVTTVCGYGDAADDVPRPIRQAALVMLSDLYEHREHVTVGVAAGAIPMPLTAERLIAPYRRVIG